jgi:hypothetical protein
LILCESGGGGESESGSESVNTLDSVYDGSVDAKTDSYDGGGCVALVLVLIPMHTLEDTSFSIEFVEIDNELPINNFYFYF